MDFKNLFVRRLKPEAPLSLDQNSPPESPAPIDPEPVDYQGSSRETAIVVGSVHEEYVWMKTHYADYAPRSQNLIEVSGRAYDVMRWCNAAGDEVTIYFDIASFYGKLPE